MYFPWHPWSVSHSHTNQQTTRKQIFQNCRFEYTKLFDKMFDFLNFESTHYVCIFSFAKIGPPQQNSIVVHSVRKLHELFSLTHFCSFWIHGHTNIRPPETRAGLVWHTPAKQIKKTGNLEQRYSDFGRSFKRTTAKNTCENAIPIQAHCWGIL